MNASTVAFLVVVAVAALLILRWAFRAVGKGMALDELWKHGVRAEAVIVSVHDTKSRLGAILEQQSIGLLLGLQVRDLDDEWPATVKVYVDHEDEGKLAAGQRLVVRFRSSAPSVVAVDPSLGLQVGLSVEAQSPTPGD